MSIYFQALLGLREKAEELRADNLDLIDRPGEMDDIPTVWIIDLVEIAEAACDWVNAPNDTRNLELRYQRLKNAVEKLGETA